MVRSQALTSTTQEAGFTLRTERLGPVFKTKILGRPTAVIVGPDAAGQFIDETKIPEEFRHLVERTNQTAHSVIRQGGRSADCGRRLHLHYIDPQLTEPLHAAGGAPAAGDRIANRHSSKGNVP